MAFATTFPLPNLSSKPNHSLLTSPNNKIHHHPFNLLHRPPLFRVACGSHLRGRDSVNFNLFASATTTDTLVDDVVGKVQLPRDGSWSVHKFGGTCVGTSERIQNVANIIVEDESERKLVVVSAMSKVTDMMYDLIHKAQSRDDSYIIALDVVLEKHKSMATDLLEGDDLSNFVSRLYEDINNLKAMLRAIFIAGHVTESFSDFVVGHGELWSAQLLSAVVRKSGLKCSWMDTRKSLL